MPQLDVRVVDRDEGQLCVVVALRSDGVVGLGIGTALPGPGQAKDGVQMYRQLPAPPSRRDLKSEMSPAPLRRSRVRSAIGALSPLETGYATPLDTEAETGTNRR